MEKFDETLALIDKADFDFCHRVVTNLKINETLTSASRSELKVEKSGFRVTASSAGKSFLVLPIQHSFCLTWTPSTPGGNGATLMQANIFQPGLLFKGEIDGFISYRYGLLSEKKCRFLDAENFKNRRR